MPPKQRITREMIMERAFEMFCREGMEAVNARSVAKALNCSTQPIFSYYTGMPELRDMLDAKAQEMFEARVLSTAQSESWLVDLCEACVCFACEQPHICMRLHDLIREDLRRLSTLRNLYDAVIEQIMLSCGITREKATQVCRETLVYACGLSVAAMASSPYMGDVRARIETAYRGCVAVMA